jgi:hypothetical protein
MAKMKALPPPEEEEYEEETVPVKPLAFWGTAKGLLWALGSFLLGSFVFLVVTILLLIPLGIFETFTVLLLRFLGVHV